MVVGGGEEGDDGSYGSLRQQIQDQADLLESFGVKIIILIDRVERYGDFQNEIRRFSNIDIIVTDSAGNSLSVGSDGPNGPFNYISDNEGYVQVTGDYPRVGEDRKGAPALLVDSQGKPSGAQCLIRKPARFDRHTILTSLVCTAQGKTISWEI